jgi:hypothetical protein
MVPGGVVLVSIIGGLVRIVGISWRSVWRLRGVVVSVV